MQMIIESKEWKSELAKNSTYIKKRLSLINGDARNSHNLQIKITINALVSRRLLETPKVDDRFRKIEIKSLSFPWKGKVVDVLNWHKVEEKYQLNNPVPGTVSFSRICNIIIHSYVWIWECDEENVVGIYLASDNTKNKKLINVNINELIVAFNSLSKSWPGEINMIRKAAGRHDRSAREMRLASRCTGAEQG
jgi:hypothetical protein